MFLLRLFLLAVATFFLADGASNHYPIAIKNRLLQEAPPADAIPLTLGVPSDPLAELMADSEAFFYLDLSPENAGTFITCSTDATNGDVDLNVGVDFVPNGFEHSCSSLTSSAFESCPVFISPDSTRIYLEVGAYQTTAELTVLCETFNVPSLFLDVATEPIEVLEGGSFFLYEIDLAGTDAGSILCSAKGENGDLGLRVGVDGLPLGSDRIKSSCQTYTLTPPYVGSLVEACNVTASINNEVIFVHVKAYEATEAVTVICEACTAEVLDGISTIVYGNLEQLKDATMVCSEEEEGGPIVTETPTSIPSTMMPTNEASLFVTAADILDEMEFCLQSLGVADSDLNGFLNEEEDSAFVRLLAESRCLSGFSSGGRAEQLQALLVPNNTTSDETLAGLPVAGSLTPDTRTDDQLAFLTAVCDISYSYLAPSECANTLGLESHPEGSFIRGSDIFPGLTCSRDVQALRLTQPEIDEANHVMESEFLKLTLNECLEDPADPTSLLETCVVNASSITPTYDNLLNSCLASNLQLTMTTVSFLCYDELILDDGTTETTNLAGGVFNEFPRCIPLSCFYDFGGLSFVNNVVDPIQNSVREGGDICGNERETLSETAVTPTELPTTEVPLIEPPATPSTELPVTDENSTAPIDTPSPSSEVLVKVEGEDTTPPTSETTPESTSDTCRPLLLSSAICIGWLLLNHFLYLHTL